MWCTIKFICGRISSATDSRAAARKSNTSILAFAVLVGQWDNSGLWNVCGRGWGLSLSWLIEKAGTILFLCLPLPVFTTGLMPRAAMRWSRGRSQENQGHNQLSIHWLFILLSPAGWCLYSDYLLFQKYKPYIIMLTYSWALSLVAQSLPNWHT